MEGGGNEAEFKDWVRLQRRSVPGVLVFIELGV